MPKVYERGTKSQYEIKEPRPETPLIEQEPAETHGEEGSEKSLDLNFQHYVLKDGKPFYVDGKYDKDGLVKSALKVVTEAQWQNKEEKNAFIADLAAKFGISPSVLNALRTSEMDLNDAIELLDSYTAQQASPDLSISVGTKSSQEVDSITEEEDDGSSEDDDSNDGNEW